MTTTRYRLARRRLRPAILATNSDSSASMRSDTPESRFPLFHSHPDHVDTFHSFDIFNFDIFDFVASSLENSATYDFVSLARALPLLYVEGRNAGEREALCHWFSNSSASGTSGTAFCGIARDLDCWIPRAMAFGWRIADRKVLP
jgi:hypothetical protein